jgi:hypothetical protein
MQTPFRAFIALTLNVLLFIQPLFIHQTARAAPAPAPRVWESGKPWTVLREISIKLRDHLNNLQRALPRVDRLWLENTSRLTSVDSDVRAACRFWSSPGMFHELEAFAPTNIPSAVALRNPDGWLTAYDLTRWIESSDAPNTESAFIEFLNVGAVRCVGLSRLGLLNSIPANFFEILDTPSGKSITAETKAAVLFVLTDDMHRFEAGIGAGYWKKYFESGASPADSRASCLSAINRVWAQEDVQTLYCKETKVWLSLMSGAESGTAQSFLSNGTDGRTAGNRLYQSVANHYNQVYSPGRWKNTSENLSMADHAFTVVKSAGFSGSSLLFYAGQIRFYRNLLGAEVCSPLKLASQLGEELQLAMPNSFAAIRTRVESIRDGSHLRSLLRSQVSVEKALTIYFEAVAGYVACLPQADVDALNQSLHDGTATVLIDESVGKTNLTLWRELFLDNQDNTDPVKVEQYLNKLLLQDPNALTMPGLSEPVKRGDVFKMLKVVWDTSLKQPATLGSSLDKIRNSKDFAKLFPNLSQAGSRGLLHATSAILASAALALNASSDPSSLTKSPTAIAELSVGAFKIAVTLGEAASKYASTALTVSDPAVLKAYTTRLKKVASATKTVGGIANVATGVLGLVGSIQQLSQDRPTAALGITSSVITMIEGVSSAAEGLVTIAGLSNTLGAVLATVSTIATVIGAVAIAATLIYGVIQEVNERSQASAWVGSLWISTGKLQCGVWLPYVENYQLSGMSGQSTISIGPRDQLVCLRLKSLGKMFEPSDKIYLYIPKDKQTVSWITVPVAKSFEGLGEMVIYVDRQLFAASDFSLDASANLFKANIYPAGDWLTYGVQSNPLSLRMDSSPPPAVSSISQKWSSLNGAVVKTITGQSEAGAVVKANGTLGVLKAVTTAGLDGRWSMDVEWPAEPWPNELWSFSSTDSLGNTSSATTALMLTRFPPNPPLDTTFTVISAFSSNTSPAYLQFLGKGSPDHVIEVSHVFGAVATTIVRPDGNWGTETSTSGAMQLLGTNPVFVVIKQFSPEGKLLNTLTAHFEKMASRPGGQLVYSKTGGSKL